MVNRQQTVVLVDGYSTGMLYLPLLEQQGYGVVHVRSTSAQDEHHYNQVAQQALERLGDRLLAQVDGSGRLEDVVCQLEPYAAHAVFAGCEGGVELADALAQRLGLPGNDVARSAARRDKYAMHQAVAQAGLRSLGSLLTDDVTELCAWVEEHGRFPVVLKPSRSAGTDGVQLCRNLDEVRAAFAGLQGRQSFFGEAISQVLVQEFAAGNEVVVNTVSRDGRHMVSGLWRYTKLVTDEGHAVYDSTELVADFGDRTEAVLTYAFGVLDALGLRNGPAHMEVMLTDTGPVLIECGARPMGGCFPQDLVRECLGRTQLELSRAAYLEPDVFARWCEQPYTIHKAFLLKCLISYREGRLDAIPAVSLLTALPSVRCGNFAGIFAEETVHPTVDLFTSPAHVCLCHEDPEQVRLDHELVRALEEEAQNMLFELAPGDGLRMDSNWVSDVPDQYWLKPSEEEQAQDAETIAQALQLQPGMTVLDCPCGDGRIGVQLARQGIQLTGIDLNPRFVSRAQERFAAEQLPGTFRVGDMRELAEDACYDVVLNWFNSFGYFDIETDFDVMRRLARAVRPGGLLLVEAPNRQSVIANTRTKVLEDGTAFERCWDEVTERLYMPMQLGEGTETRTVETGARMYSLAQYQLFFRLAGLEFVSVYGENLTPFSEASRRMVLLARRS